MGDESLHRRHRSVVRRVHSSTSSHKSGSSKHGTQSAKAPARTHASSKSASRNQAPSKTSQRSKSRAKNAGSSTSSAHSSSKKSYSPSTLRHLGSKTSSHSAPSSTAGAAPVINASDGGSDLSGGAIAGIAIGAFVGLALIALVAYLLSRWKPSARSEDEAPAPAFAAEPPVTQAPPAEPVMEPTMYTAQDATYAMPMHYPVETLAPYMEQDPGPPAPLGPEPWAAEEAPTGTVQEPPLDFGMYEQDPIGSVRRQNTSSRPSSRGSLDKYDAYAESWPSRVAPQYAADVSLQDGASYMPMSDWDDNASELPYIRTPRRRGRGERETRRHAPIS
ncbi:hypothetical protein MCAP1_002155 [Malassezia caprae]|uniref:Uncharacterized protein n=1 Tax=Malassezia caprae TaxID=1381934 RepID=A0AAF0IWS6_9BASI|nr:hypothetical protein MCAP1_002155 [Malassezia caprae]